jgi:hypothetical protein
MQAANCVSSARNWCRLRPIRSNSSSISFKQRAIVEKFGGMNDRGPIVTQNLPRLPKLTSLTPNSDRS